MTTMMIRILRSAFGYLPSGWRVKQKSHQDDGQQQPKIIRQNSLVAQCSDDIDVDNYRKSYKEPDNDEGLLEYIDLRVPCTDVDGDHCDEINERKCTFINIQTGEKCFTESPHTVPFVECDDEHLNGIKSQIEEEYCPKEQDKSSIELVSDLNKVCEDILKAEKGKAMEKNKDIEILTEKWTKLFESFLSVINVKSVVNDPISFEIRLPCGETLEYVLQELEIAQIAIQKCESIVVYTIRYKHHIVLVQEPTLDSSGKNTYTKYQSTGDFGNLRSLKPIADYQETREMQIKDLKTSYDYAKGVHCVVYPRKHSKEKVVQRAKYCHEYLQGFYYLFSCLNCESVITYIMTGQGYSLQLQTMGRGMWVLSDILDNFCYCNFIVLLLGSLILNTNFLTFSVDLIITCFIIQNCQREQFQEDVYCKRHQIKYLLSFIFRVVTTYNSDVYWSYLCLPSFMMMPAVIGLLFDVMFHTLCNDRIASSMKSLSALGLLAFERIYEFVNRFNKDYLYFMCSFITESFYSKKEIVRGRNVSSKKKELYHSISYAREGSYPTSELVMNIFIFLLSNSSGNFCQFPSSSELFDTSVHLIIQFMRALILIDWFSFALSLLFVFNLAFKKFKSSQETKNAFKVSRFVT